MKPVWRYSLFGLAAYLLFMLLLFPADRVYSFFQQRAELPVSLYQVSGSIWQGNIGSARVAGLNVDNVDWCLHPWALLLGRLEMGLSLANVDSDVGLVVGRNFDGSYYVRSIDGLSIPVLESLFNEQPFGLTGMADLDLDDIRLVDGRLDNVSGSISWQQAGLSEPLNIELGDFNILLAAEDGSVQGTLKDDGGPLQAEGVLMLLPDSSYRMTMTLRSRDKTRTDIKQALSLLGTPSQEGKVSLVRRGQMNLSSWRR